MSDLLRQDLEAQLSNGNALVVVGAGVSLQATGGAQVASWRGLLESGIDRCEQVGRPLPEGWADRRRDELASNDLDEWLSAAENITRRLNGRAGGEYARWLADTVGALKIEEPHQEVLDAVTSLGVPVATTNYDNLLEDATGRHHVTWREPSDVQLALRGERDDIVHLHGHWRDPESVVLGISSYGDALGNEAAQALLQAAGTLRSLVLVGFGAGLGDPNFGALRKWLAATFPAARHRNFRLVLAADHDAAVKEHPPEEGIAVVTFGDTRNDLAGFLQGVGGAAGAGPATTAPGRHTSRTQQGPDAGDLPPKPLTLGRAGQVRQLADILTADDPLPAAVLGGPGIGKSNLCVSALHDPSVAARFGDRRLFVRCDGAAEASTVIAALASALGLPVTSEPWPSVRTAAASEPTAVVLDNLETAWEPDTTAVEDLLARLAPIEGLALMVTMRGTQRPGGPQWADPIYVAPLGDDDARALFLSVAGQRHAEDRDLGALLTKLDGVPLAVLLVAHQAEAEATIASLLERWEQERAKLLRRGSGADRHLSMEVSVGLSMDSPLMTDDARRLAGLLGILPDGIADTDLESLLPGRGPAAAAVLRQRGLVVPGDGRTRVLQPIRECLAANHEPTEEDLHRTIDHYVGLAEQLGNQVGRAAPTDGTISNG